jgi:hypothetical protein
LSVITILSESIDYEISIVSDQADMASLGRVSRAKLAQIMNLLNLALDIQKPLLFLPQIESGGNRFGKGTRVRLRRARMDGGRGVSGNIM